MALALLAVGRYFGRPNRQELRLSGFDPAFRRLFCLKIKRKGKTGAVRLDRWRVLSWAVEATHRFVSPRLSRAHSYADLWTGVVAWFTACSLVASAVRCALPTERAAALSGFTEHAARVRGRAGRGGTPSGTQVRWARYTYRLCCSLWLHGLCVRVICTMRLLFFFLSPVLFLFSSFTDPLLKCTCILLRPRYSLFL